MEFGVASTLVTNRSDLVKLKRDELALSVTAAMRGTSSRASSPKGELSRPCCIGGEGTSKRIARGAGELMSFLGGKLG